MADVFIEVRGAYSFRVRWRYAKERRSATFPTRAEAETAQRLIELRNGAVTSSEVYEALVGPVGPKEEKPPTVEEFAEQWIIERRKIRDVEPSVLDGYYSVIRRHIVPHLGTLPISAVTSDVVRLWVVWMSDQEKLSGGLLDADTIRRAHSVLHSLLGAAVPRWLPANPAAKQPGKRRELPKETPHDAVFLTPQEVAVILRNCDEHIYPLVFTAVRTGMRLGELLALQVQHVTVTGPNKQIQVQRALKKSGRIGVPKSRRSRRAVSIHSDVAEVLKPLLRGKRRDALVFTSPAGKLWHPSNLRRRHWIPAVAAAQRCPQHPPPLPEKTNKFGPRRGWRPDEISTCDCPTRLHRVPRFHDLRHTHVSMCAEAGWQMDRVSRRVGHESIKTTYDLYRHLWEKDDSEDLEALERLMRVEELTEELTQDETHADAEDDDLESL